MATFLFKTEPDCYPWSKLVEDKRATWDGVSNAAALKHIRSAKKGDEVFIYHTGDERSIVGLAQIVSDPYEDPSDPGLNSRGEPAVAVVDVKPLRPVKTPVTLAEVKADPRFKDFPLVTQGRLGVMPVPPAIDKLLRKMAGL
jgi:predicted RNA-binding protein with PUA-like domain